jgi:hypothetical protein
MILKLFGSRESERKERVIFFKMTLIPIDMNYFIYDYLSFFVFFQYTLLPLRCVWLCGKEVEGKKITETDG